jgi:hypothetical protein
MVLIAILLAFVAITGIVVSFKRLQFLNPRYQLTVSFITLWAVVFVGMTLFRLSITPLVASSGLIIWVAFRLLLATLAGSWPLVVDLLGEAILVAGFCGYMATGNLPRAYYGRRHSTG